MSETVAERYAQAIFELGVETGGVTALIEDFRRLSDMYEESEELRKIMNNPLVAEADRLATVNELSERLGLTDLGKNAAGLLTRRKRMYALTGIANELDRLSDQRAGIVRATVVSAEPLSESFAAKLADELKTMTGKRVVLDQRHDPELLAGLIIRIGDQVIDGSARTKLAELSAHLLQS
ncbi:MAG TPA: ATP synthase F1 subunit delta [Polyangiaceae bacterium]|nr:ATP synthase F1 subunit delta [Polyangiaceae bacterium]